MPEPKAVKQPEQSWLRNKVVGAMKAVGHPLVSLVDVSKTIEKGGPGQPEVKQVGQPVKQEPVKTGWW